MFLDCCDMALRLDQCDGCQSATRLIYSAIQPACLAASALSLRATHTDVACARLIALRAQSATISKSHWRLGVFHLCEG